MVFLLMPVWVAISSMDTDLIPILMMSSFAFCNILICVSKPAAKLWKLFKLPKFP
jgi:hypothetical protein